MKFTKITCFAGSLGIATVLGTSTSVAGDREWATAGKILSGVVAAHVLSDTFLANRSSYNNISSHNSSLKRRNNYTCRPRKRSYRKHYYSHRNHWSRIAPYPHSRTRSIRRAHVVVPECDDYIVVNIEDGRRIIQPRVKGVAAYLQVYSKVCDEWVTIEEYPSIW